MTGAPYPAGDLNPRLDPVLDFPDRDLSGMSPADYDAIGFLGGIEVHQQLRTRRKLFCRCPAGVYVDRYDAEVLRHMRPTLSELGVYDGCALMEFKTRKEIVYLLDRGTVCTYEIDDTPPFEIDEEAIRHALEVARLFDLSLVSELHVMRKQYLDGSIPTGFQRTAMIGLAGEVPFRVPELGIDRTLRIRQVSLEEDSCREVSDRGHRIIFRTDRLGMPLTEVVTEPDARTPHELQAIARLVANTTRTLGTAKIRRGAGAARQDVNVSVAGGRRVEIKGVPRHRGLPELVHVEAFRQLNLLRIREELRNRGVSAAELEIGPEKGRAWEISALVADVTSLLKSCDYAPIRDSLDANESLVAVRLPRFRGLLVHATQPGLTFANELMGRLRVIACLTSRPFLAHSDIEGYGLSPAEWRHVRAALKAADDDAVLVVWGPSRDLDTAARELLLRAQDAIAGVPSETRQAHSDGTTSFERILPGADRMYPDTDTPPFPVPDAWVEAIEARRPERPWERTRRYEAMGLEATTAARLATAGWADLFDEVTPAPGAVARGVASAFERRLARLVERDDTSRLPVAARVVPLVRALEAELILPEGFEVGLQRLLADSERDPAAIVAELSPLPPDDPGLVAAVAGALAEAEPHVGTPLDARMRWTMGSVMSPWRGRVRGSAVANRLRAGLERRPSPESAR